MPEPAGIVALAKQVKASHRAYPLYGLGRMFLNKPERHRVRVTSNAPAYPLYQIGEDGPVTLNRHTAERDAFLLLRSKYYTEETVQIEAPKGNYSNVARCRFSGVLLGPTNHHGYQPALRRLFESRFSRRMDFNEFLRQIEIVNDPAVVEEWKKQSSSVVVYRTIQEAEPLEFKTVPEVEAHFRQTYLAQLIKTGRSMEMSGLASREVADREIRDCIRNAWEKERGFPAQIVNQIRPRFMEAGLHIWKHRKRILYISTARPVRFGAEAKNVSAHIADILNIVETSPKCTRAEIYTQLLKPHEQEEEFPKLKASLASDLHWLVQSGHIIEFHDGILDLPLLPKDLAKEPQGREGEEQSPAGQKRAEPAAGEPQGHAPMEIVQPGTRVEPSADSEGCTSVDQVEAPDGTVETMPGVPIIDEKLEPAALESLAAAPVAVEAPVAAPVVVETPEMVAVETPVEPAAAGASLEALPSNYLPSPSTE